MPGIVVFRRRWMVASDDFVIPFGLAFVLRAAWMITLSVSVGVYHGFTHEHEFGGRAQHVCELTLDYYIGGYLALLFATNIMELSIAWMSSKGSIMDTEPRNLIPQLLYVRLTLTLIELVWLSVGIKWIYLDLTDCGVTSEVYIARAIVAFNWIFLFGVGLIVYCSFDSAGRSWFHLQRGRQAGLDLESTDGHSLNIIKKYEENWTGRFEFFCCCAGRSSDDNVLSQIGSTLSGYFQDLDIVPSDFAAGLVLLRRHQKRLEERSLMGYIEQLQVSGDPDSKSEFTAKRAMRYQRTTSARPLRMDNKSEMLLFQDVVHYMHFALAAYGWPLYMKNHLGTGCCRLAKSFRCCYERRKADRRMSKYVDVESDNCCRCNFSALKRIAHLHNCDVTYVSYHNELYQSPFFVALDHERKSVVVTVRGTLSLQDMLTDSAVEPEEIPLEGGDPSWFGHKGMIRTALYIKKKLEQGILEAAFNAEPERGTESYRLILVGHSLGAGTVSILAILLRPQYPNLFCYAYSPPGANLSLSAANYARDFTISVVVGKDMIPRLSLYTLEDLRDKVLAVISHSNVSKWKILRGCACRCAFLCCYRCQCVDCEAPIVQEEEEFLDFDRLNQLSNAARNNDTLRFYPPGRVLHIVKTLSPPGCLGQRGAMFEPVWADIEDFQSLQISGLMWADHMPDFVLKALKKCIPSRLQGETVLNAPEGPNAATSGPPAANWVAMNHVPNHDANEHIEKTPHATSIMGRNPSGVAPLARPESGLDDWDLSDTSGYRVSRSWVDFSLSTVQQSSESLNKPRVRASTENFSNRSSANHSRSSSLTALPIGPPPPKPPRAFARELPGDRPSAPPKPPRTFEYDRLGSRDSSSSDWNFPQKGHDATLTCSCNGDQHSQSCTQNSWKCTCHSHASCLKSVDGDCDAHVSWKSSQGNGITLSSSKNSCLESCEEECGDMSHSEALPPYSSHKKYRRLDETTTDHENSKNFQALSPGRESTQESSPILDSSRLSFSDSIVYVSPEESLLLGSVKPRRGRRRDRAPAGTTSTPALTKSLLESTL